MSMHGYLNRIIKLAFAVLPILALSGCISLLPSAGPQPKLLDLNPRSAHLHGKTTTAIIIDEPKASLIFNSTNIIFKKQGCSGLAYFTHVSQNAWNERLPLLLQRTLVHSLRSENGPYVASDKGEAYAKYRLGLDISKFNIVEPGQIEIAFYATLIDQQNQTVLASREFNRTSISEPRVSAYMQAFDDSLSQIISEMSSWIDEQLYRYNKIG